MCSWCKQKEQRILSVYILVGQIDLVMKHVLVYILYVKIIQFNESHFPDHSQIYVPIRLRSTLWLWPTYCGLMFNNGGLLYFLRSSVCCQGNSSCTLVSPLYTLEIRL